MAATACARAASSRASIAKYALFGSTRARRTFKKSSSPDRSLRGTEMLGPSAHIDTFTRDNLPPQSQWPDFLLDGFDYPGRLNAAVELTDAMVAKGFGDNTALIGNGRRRTYKELTDWSNRIAHALVENYGVKPGDRVLIRSANNPAMVACWLGATKAGAVVVNTMPMLRAGELGKIALNKPVKFDAVETGRDDVALLGFTSGTTGEPKATMHFHRDLLIIADAYAKEVLSIRPDDVF